MTTTHTPGPWVARKVTRDGTQFIGPADDPILRVAKVFGAFTPGTARDLRDANARLIAAAPDLLAALEVAEARIAAKADWIDRNGSGSIFDEGIHADLNTIRAALARVK